ncbi:MAG: hypothetical protein PHD54_12535 [Desulfuromonadaceae bacterium]|nr:hypothetical protein [Desulfuromonadaceae bacterium]
MKFATLPLQLPQIQAAKALINGLQRFCAAPQVKTAAKYLYNHKQRAHLMRPLLLYFYFYMIFSAGIVNQHK